MTRSPIAAAALAALTLCACRIDPIGRLTADDAEPRGEPLSRSWSIPDVEPAPTETARLAVELARYLGVLAGPYLMGRRPGTEGARQTVAYLVSAQTGAGLQPAAKNGGWLQPVALRVSSSAGRAALRTRTGDIPLDAGLALARAGAVGKYQTIAPLVDAGHGITAPEWSLDDYQNVPARGAAVLVRAGVPAGRDAASDYGGQTYKFDRAARAGAAAALLLTGISQKEPAWEEAVHQFSVPWVALDGVERPKGVALDISGLVSAEAEAQLLAGLERAGRVDASRPELLLEVDTYERTLEDPNVIARIAGAEAPEQSVVVVAHWDAGGHGAALPAGGGNEENGTGVALALAIAARAAEWSATGRPPLRSIVFVFTAAGSLGPFGAESHVLRGIPDPRNVAAVIVLDGFDLHSPDAHLVVVGAERTSLEPALAAAFGPRLQREPAGSIYDGTERAVFDAAGLVTLAFTRRDPAEPLQDRPFDAATDLLPLASAAHGVLEVVWQIANGPALPARIEPIAEP